MGWVDFIFGFNFTDVNNKTIQTIKKFDKETKWDTFKDLKSKFLPFSELKEIFENKNRKEIISEVFGI